MTERRHQRLRVSTRRRFLLAGVLGTVLGCDTAARLERRCAEGDTSACFRACEKGVAGEHGCFRAGQAAWRESAASSDRPAYEKAAELFGKACDAKYADGCLYAAQMIEAPYAQPAIGADANAPVSTISEAELDRRQELLTRACALDNTAGCKRLGDASAGW